MRKIWKLVIKLFVGVSTVGGVIQAFLMMSQPDIDIKAILLSFPAWTVYTFICFFLVFITLRGRYKATEQKVEQLNTELDKQKVMVSSLREMMKILPFQNRFFLTTEYLYNELGASIQNHIDEASIEIKNTIEKKGWGIKEILLSN